MVDRSHKRALVVGAGGLGCPVLVALAEAGVGTLRLVDDDLIELSNLQRQVLYGVADVGRPKIDVARERLEGRYGVTVETASIRADAATLDGLLEGVDVVIDATDDPEARFLINDRALAHGIPAVLGGVIRFEGLVMGVHQGGGACFRCLFESPPEAGEVMSCASAGVVGAMAGVVGHLQAERALALLDGELASSTGFVTTIDGLRGVTRDVPLRPNPMCSACGDAHAPMPASTTLIDQEFPMSVAIKIPTSLRRFVGGVDQVDVSGQNVREALDGLEEAHPGIKSKICDADGNLRRFINVYANQEDIRFLDNLETHLAEGAELQIVPAIAGG